MKPQNQYTTNSTQKKGRIQYVYHNSGNEQKNGKKKKPANAA